MHIKFSDDKNKMINLIFYDMAKMLRFQGFIDIQKFSFILIFIYLIFNDSKNDSKGNIKRMKKEANIIIESFGIFNEEILNYFEHTILNDEELKK